jgi:alkylated DNA repair dioxygenase AlkB
MPPSDAMTSPAPEPVRRVTAFEPQLGLFADAPLAVVDESRGGIGYTPGVVDPARAWEWFEQIRDGIAWISERRQMYDREVDVPRLHAALAFEEMDLPALRAAAVLVREKVGAPFNSVGLNYYRDGRDSVAPHNDHLDEIVRGEPIALLSLGHPRRMTIQAKQPPRRTRHIDLAPGSLLVMSWESQLHWLHGIPKIREAPERVPPRISLAFRVKPRAQKRSGRYA